MTQLVKQAVTLFKQGNYQQARQFYQQAAQKYGHHLFKINIALCDRYLTQKPLPVATAFPTAQSQQDTASSAELSALTQQLAETQSQLEHYYTRCQQLQNQIMDAR